MILRDSAARIATGRLIVGKVLHPRIRIERPGEDARDLALNEAALAGFVVLSVGWAERVDLRDAGVSVGYDGRLVLGG